MVSRRLASGVGVDRAWGVAVRLEVGGARRMLGGEIAKTQRPDLVVLDIRMDGEELGSHVDLAGPACEPRLACDYARIVAAPDAPQLSTNFTRQPRRN
ncbi:MAG: hypothetical protein JO057_19135 [Chloroflexi bacterium]|nr:hypothetical protein [Chloroflexota bacterium]